LDATVFANLTDHVSNGDYESALEHNGWARMALRFAYASGAIATAPP
jgi:hypothetical protein